MRRALVLVVAAIGSGCGTRPVVRPEPQFPSCRSLVTHDRGPAPPVRWYGPPQEDEVDELFGWCRMTGPLTVRRAATPVEPVDSLAILSWNVELGAAAVAAVVDSLRAGRYTRGHPVRHYVLVLQEVFREGPLVPGSAPKGTKVGRGVYPAASAGERLDVAALATALDLHLYYAPSVRNGRGLGPKGLPEDRGNAILATVPLDDFVAIDLPFFGLRRVAQLATASGTTSAGRPWRVQVANVHFDIGHPGPAMISAGRARQARAVTQVMDSGAAILAGDTNAPSLIGTASAIEVLQAAFPESPEGDRRATRGWFRIDYQYYRLPPGYSAANYRRLESTFGSDHFPLLGWLRFE